MGGGKGCIYTNDKEEERRIDDFLLDSEVAMHCVWLLRYLVVGVVPITGLDHTFSCYSRLFIFESILWDLWFILVCTW